MVVLRILILYSLILGISCTKQNQKIQFILPDSTTSKKVKWLEAMEEKSRALNLKNLEFGVDSLEIRIYENIAVAEPKFLIIIKKENKIWSGSSIAYWSHLEPPYNYSDRQKDTIKHFLIIDSTTSKNIVPKCSWESLIDSLNYFGIYKLPSQANIKGFEDHINDGIGYTFEVATKNLYKVFYYHCPDAYNDPSNKAAANMLRMLQRQLRAIDLCNIK